MNSFSELTQLIDPLLPSKKPLTLAISGFGGSGKTTLTNQLRDHYHINNNQIIRIDHLYAENWDGPHYLDQTNWPLLQSILSNAKQGNPLNYKGTGFRNVPIIINEPLPNLLIIEGVRLLQPSLMHLFDLSIWINYPYEKAIQRAKARDHSQGEDPNTIALWDTDWGPKDLQYVKECQPEKLASILYNPS